MSVFTPEHLATLRPPLRHVYWIGGPPDGGKSTIAQLLGQEFGLQIYHQDRHEPDHLQGAGPARHPALSQLATKLTSLPEAGFLDWLWLSSGPRTMADMARATWSERIGLVVDDLLAMPHTLAIIAEGPGFFPDVISPLLTDPSPAVWLLPTPAFKRSSHDRRGKSRWRDLTSNPSPALANHIARDLHLIELYRQDLDRLQLPYLEVDGTADPQVVAKLVAQHFISGRDSLST